MGEGKGPDIVRGIRAKIAKGRLPLPADGPRKVAIGNGTGRPCDGCDQPITDAQAEYEIEMSTGGTIRCHKLCLDVWHAERAPAAEPSPPTLAALVGAAAAMRRVWAFAPTVKSRLIRKRAS